MAADTTAVAMQPPMVEVVDATRQAITPPSFQPEAEASAPAGDLPPLLFDAEFDKIAVEAGEVAVKMQVADANSKPSPKTPISLKSPAASPKSPRVPALQLPTSSSKPSRPSPLSKSLSHPLRPTSAPAAAKASGPAALRASVTLGAVHTRDLRISTSSLSGLSPRHDGMDTPSYLRPTASHQARSKVGGPLADPQAPPAQQQQQQQAPGSADKKKKNMLARLGSTLLAPTSAFLARVTGKKDRQVREEAEAARTMRTSQMLSVVLDSPQGQRVTKAQPFSFRTEVRPKAPLPPTTDEMQLAEAARHQFKRHEVPKHVHESRPLEFRAASSPRSPQDVFKPFNLGCVEKHEAFRVAKEARLAREQQEVEAKRVFKAKELDKKLVGWLVGWLVAVVLVLVRCLLGWWDLGGTG